MKFWDALRNSGKVIKEGLITPNEFNEPAATRFKQSIYPLAGVPGAVAETADELYKGNPGMAALAATGAIPGIGAIGSLIRHGSPNILLSHGSGANSLLELLRGKDKALDAPSMATSKLVNPFGSEVVMYPRPQKFDPGVNKNSDLFATDAYTYRRGQEQAGFGGNSIAPPYARQKFRKDPRLTEQANVNSPSKLATIVASPKFKSFTQYEDELADIGSGRLTSRHIQDADYADFSDELNSVYPRWVEKRMSKMVENPIGSGVGDDFGDDIGDDFGDLADEFISIKDLSLLKPNTIQEQKAIANLLREHGVDESTLMSKFLSENPQYKAMANRMPSEYGELKYHGKVPVDRENIAAVRLANMNSQNNEELIKALRRQGIPIVPGHMTTQREIANFVDYLTGLRDDYNPRLEKIIATKGSIDLNDVSFEKVGPIMMKYGIPGDDLGVDAQSYLSHVAKELTKKGASGKELDVVVKAMKAAQKKQ